MRIRKYPAPPVDKLFIVHRGAVDSYTVQPDGIDADQYGHKWARSGSFIDAEGNVVTLTASGEDPGEKELEFGSDPIGIITETVDVTDGPNEVAVLRSGEIEAENLNYPDTVEYDAGFNASIEEALPHILCHLTLTQGE